MSNDPRLWVHKLGVTMDEPKVRYIIDGTQNMTSIEYTGPNGAELTAFARVMYDYLNYCMEWRLAQQEGRPHPGVPHTILELMAPREVKRAAKAH